MLHHSALHWPDATDVESWPTAIYEAERVLNVVPRPETGQSAFELFTRTTAPRTKLHEFHVWGCPTYVLDHAISSGKSLPRWQPRGGRHQCLGTNRRCHSSSVPLVLNLQTGEITNQCHVVCDDWFHTVKADEGNPPDFEDDDWCQTFGLTESQYVRDEWDEDGTPPEGAPLERELRSNRDRIARIQDEADPAVPLPVPPPSSPYPSPTPCSTSCKSGTSGASGTFASEGE